MKITKDIFGERLKDLRNKAGLTQTALAEKSGVSQSQISNYEAGRWHSTWETVCKLAKALGVSTEEFQKEK